MRKRTKATHFQATPADGEQTQEGLFPLLIQFFLSIQTNGIGYARCMLQAL